MCGKLAGLPRDGAYCAEGKARANAAAVGISAEIPRDEKYRGRWPSGRTPL